VIDSIVMASARAPRIRAQINGEIVDSIMNADWTDGGSCKGATFELTISTSGNRSENRWLDLLTGRVAVQIYMNAQRADSKIMTFEGLADNIAIDPINNTARILGRDYSSVLANSAYQVAFCNQTASEIVSYVAARHGFNTNVSATSTIIGSYLGDDYNQVLLNAHSQITSEWELLIYLARSEGFELFVDGRTLVFASSGSLPLNKISINVGDAIAMKFYRNCPLSSQTILTVKSWNSWLAQALHYSDGNSSGQNIPDVPGLNADPGTAIAIVTPNLSSHDAERLANQHLRALTKRTLTVQIAMLGDMLLKPRDVLAISGCGNGFDANYTVLSVRRHFSTTSGFIQYIKGFQIEAALLPSTGGGASQDG